jgi:hypothetical protein
MSAEHGEGVVDLFEHLRPFVEREEGEEEEEGARASEARHRRPPECRASPPDQPHPRAGAADHRARSRDHPRFDRDRLGLAHRRRGAAGPADRHRGNAQARQDRRQAGEAVGRRRPAGRRFRRSRGAAARRHPGLECRTCRSPTTSCRGPGADHRDQQMGRRREPELPVPGHPRRARGRLAQARGVPAACRVRQ